MNKLGKDTLLLALTGGIGSGKSVIARKFEEKGAFVIFADELAKDLLWTNLVVNSAVKHEFGEIVLDDERNIDKQKLAETVFKDSEKLQKLNKIIHPAVRTAIENKAIEVVATKKYRIIVVEAALIFEANMEDMFDMVISTAADEQIRIERVTSRDNCSIDSVKRRMGFQLDSEEKERRSDFVLLNNGTLEILEIEFEKLYSSLVTRSKTQL